MKNKSHDIVFYNVRAGSWRLANYTARVDKDDGYGSEVATAYIAVRLVRRCACHKRLL